MSVDNLNVATVKLKDPYKETSSLYYVFYHNNQDIIDVVVTQFKRKFLHQVNFRGEHKTGHDLNSHEKLNTCEYGKGKLEAPLSFPCDFIYDITLINVPSELMNILTYRFSTGRAEHLPLEKLSDNSLRIPIFRQETPFILIACEFTKLIIETTEKVDPKLFDDIELLYYAGFYKCDIRRKIQKDAEEYIEDPKRTMYNRTYTNKIEYWSYYNNVGYHILYYSRMCVVTVCNPFDESEINLSKNFESMEISEYKNKKCLHRSEKETPLRKYNVKLYMGDKEKKELDMDRFRMHTFISMLNQ